MNQSTAWEAGQRVPSYDPRFDDGDEDECQPEPSAAVVVRVLVGFLLADTNPALAIECLALASGIGYDGASEAEIARRHKLSRAAVSKRCVELSDALGLSPVRAMRSKQNRDACREARLEALRKA
jgi:hypothetical protein